MIDEARRSLKEKLSKNNLFNKKTKGFMIPALQFIQKSVLEYCIPQYLLNKQQRSDKQSHTLFGPDLMLC